MGRARAPGGGRRPKPTVLKVLGGNPGHRPLNAREAAPRRRIPSCPAILEGEARREWHRIARKLFDAGLLTEIDGPALMAYCLAYDRLLDAEQKLRQYGAVVKAPSGYLSHSPYLAIANRALDQMRSMLVEFGMTPSSRSRVHAAGGPGSTNPEAAEVEERFFGAG
ncbi:MAG: phage terminase small subunit P27 family [Planctomycetes bacterium]|nr:phage terminase small subunit P27 family [Planctomycetota bacterium]